MPWMNTWLVGHCSPLEVPPRRRFLIQCAKREYFTWNRATYARATPRTKKGRCFSTTPSNELELRPSYFLGAAAGAAGAAAA
jgi:hypothetical protein